MTAPTEPDAPEPAQPVSEADQELMKTNLDDYVRNTVSDEQLAEGDPPTDP